MTPWPLAMFARCVARSLTYSWVYGTINPLRDSLITEVIKHLNVQTRWALDDVYAFATWQAAGSTGSIAWQGAGIGVGGARLLPINILMTRTAFRGPA